VLEYRVTQHCPERAVVLAAIRRRDATLVEAEQAPAERRFRIVVEADGPRFTGKLEQLAVGSLRQVTGENCAKVVDALSLVLALAAGATPANAEAAEPPSADTASEPLPTSDAKGSNPQSPPKAPQAQRETLKVEHAASPDVFPVPPNLRTPGLEWAVGAGAASLWGVAPVLLAGPALVLERTHDQGWLFVHLLGRLGFGVGAPNNRLQELVPELGIRGSFGAVDLAVHAGLAFGSLRLERDTGASTLWVAPLVGPTLRLHPSRRWWLELALEAGAPLVSRRVRSATGPGTIPTKDVVVGASILGGFGELFGEPTAPGITSTSVGHSRVR
jgi:hypothetical protein